MIEYSKNNCGSKLRMIDFELHLKRIITLLFPFKITILLYYNFVESRGGNEPMHFR